MTIGIDISQIAYEGTGVATYTRNLVKELLRQNTKIEHKYILFGTSMRRKKELAKFSNELYAENLKFQTSFWPIPQTFANKVWNQLHTLNIEKLIGKIDLYHSSDWTQPPTKAKKVAPINDMVVYKYPESSHPHIVAVQKKRMEWAKKEADRIITISESSKNDIVDILGVSEQKVSVVYLAAGEEFIPQSNEKILSVMRKFDLNSDFILTVGTREPRKNLKSIIDAFKKLNLSNTNLVIAGKYGWGSEQEPSDKNVKVLGFVPQDDLPSLYSAAKGFVYPSLYEGFGTPILEAMSCGCPVITGNISSMPEVGGDAAVYVQPTNVAEISDAIKSIINISSNDRKKIIAKGFTQSSRFSWNKCANDVLKIYDEVLRFS